MDLEKFFDKVNHDILMSKLEKRIKDKRLLILIGKYLKSGMLINGVRVMKSITILIENKLKLKVKKGESAMDFAFRRKFLGFSVYFSKSGAEMRINEKSINITRVNLMLM